MLMERYKKCIILKLSKIPITQWFKDLEMFAYTVMHIEDTTGELNFAHAKVNTTACQINGSRKYYDPVDKFKV